MTPEENFEKTIKDWIPDSEYVGTPKIYLSLGVDSNSRIPQFSIELSGKFNSTQLDVILRAYRQFMKEKL